MSDQTLPTCRAAALQTGGSQGIPWRIDQVWAGGVGILGGPPKCALCRARHNAHYPAPRIMPRATGIPEDLWGARSVDAA
jgi:hypothetical protein